MTTISAIYKSIKKNSVSCSGVLLCLLVFLLPGVGEGAGGALEVISEIDKSMVEIPAGEFLMGVARGDANERPVHPVYLDSYFISRYEIANRQYRAFLDHTDHPPPFFWNDRRWNADNYPVVGISWKDANAFCQWLSGMTGQIWRLPSEAEWEKASSWTGKKKLKFPWGDTFDRERVNIVDEKDGYERTAPIDSFKDGASPYGIYHLADNVAEWCLDWFENDYYAHSPAKNPQGPEESILKSVRGGEWKSNKLMIRNTFRKGDWPDLRYNYIGFRVVRVSKK